jgi:hypothetical protein
VADGWWSIAMDDTQKPVVVPGRIMSSPGRLIYTHRTGMIQLGIISNNWYHAGLLEGFVLSNDIKDHLFMTEKYYSLVSDAWNGIKGQKLAKFETLKEYCASQVNLFTSSKNTPSLNMTHVMQHLNGIVDGYNLRYAAKIENKKLPALTLADLFLINSLSEIVDLGGYLAQLPIEFTSLSKTNYAKRFSNEKTIMSALLVAGRISASMLRFHSSSETTSYPNIKTLWENQVWYPSPMKRIFVRISIESEGHIHGHQHIGFPGQVISMDSFSISLSTSKLAMVVMRQADFSTRTVASLPPTVLLSAWMPVASAFHTPNITFSQYVDIWNSSRSNILSTEWKSLSLSKGKIFEIESHFDTFEQVERTSLLLKNQFILSDPTMTLLNGPSLAQHGFTKQKHSFDKESGLQTTNVDAYRHESIWNAQKHDIIDNNKLLTTSTRKEFEEVQLEVRDQFGISFDRQTEYVVLSNLQ